MTVQRNKNCREIVNCEKEFEKKDKKSDLKELTSEAYLTRTYFIESKGKKFKVQRIKNL